MHKINKYIICTIKKVIPQIILQTLRIGYNSVGQNQNPTKKKYQTKEKEVVRMKNVSKGIQITFYRVK
jgi:hypothetical protein